LRGGKEKKGKSFVNAGKSGKKERTPLSRGKKEGEKLALESNIQ